MVDGLIAMHLERYKATGAELIMGAATFAGVHTLDVHLNAGGMRTLVGERVFLNLGTQASLPPVQSCPLRAVQALLGPWGMPVSSGLVNSWHTIRVTPGNLKTIVQGAGRDDAKR